MKMPLGLWVVSIAGLSAGSAPPETSKGMAGAWEGTLKVAPGSELRLVLRVKPGEGGSLRATVDSPDQGANGLRVDSITLTGGRLEFEMKSLGAKFTGKLDDAKGEVAGEFLQGGATFPLTLKKTDVPEFAPSEVPKALKGIWEGKIKVVADIELRLVVEVVQSKEGPLKATFQSPDQTPARLPIDPITLEGKALKFEVKSIKGKFAGKLNDAGTEAAGHWMQAGADFPLTLKKTDKVTALRRPQLPRPPFPYKAEDVTFENQAGGFRLAGTLTTPEGRGPFPAALLITGSGAQDRDESLLGHKPFLVLADALTRRGIAVLRVDDRGVGGSSGNIMAATSDDFAGDVSAGVAFLKSRSEIDPGRIGLVGHSEGGLIAPMVAARSPDVAYIVLMAGTGLTGSEILSLQGHLILKALGLTEERLKSQAETLKRLMAVVVAERDEEAATKKMGAILEEALAALPEAERKALGDSAKFIEGQVTQLRSPWFRFFLAYDPRPTLAKVRCPVLAIIGERDLQVPPKENLAEIAKALKSAGNTRVTVREMPGLNHLFQTSKTGAPSEYATIEETMAPAALQAIGDWILEQVGTKPRPRESP